MTINQCIEAMINLELDAMVWEIDNCPIDEFKELYIPNGSETHVILASSSNKYIVNRLRWQPEDRIPLEPTILRLNEDYYCYVITTDDEDELDNYRPYSNQDSQSDDLPF